MTAPPPAVQSCARDDALGHLLAVFVPAKRPFQLSGWLLFALIPFDFLVRAMPLGTLVVGAVFWPFAVRGVLHSLVLVKRTAAPRIYLYERGMVHADAAGGLELYVWDQIKKLWGLPGFPSPRYTVVRADGRKLRLNTWVGNELLAADVLARVTRAQLAVARAALKDGKSVSFGGLVVDAHQVSGPRGSAPWPEIEVMTTRWGRIAVFDTREFLPLFTAPARKTPNHSLFFALCHTYRPDLF